MTENTQTYEQEIVKLELFSEQAFDERYSITKAFESNLFTNEMLSVVSQKHFFGASIIEIAKRYGRSTTYVRGLLEDAYEALIAVDLGYKTKQVRTLHTTKAESKEDFLQEIEGDEKNVHPLQVNEWLLLHYQLIDLSILDREPCEPLPIDYKPLKIYEEMDEPVTATNWKNDWIASQRHYYKIESWDVITESIEKPIDTPMSRQAKDYYDGINLEGEN